MSRLVLRVVSGGRAGEVVAFTRARVLVGRRSDADLRFDPDADRQVSGHHALFERHSSAWTVRDLESLNGTWVDGVRIAAAHPLSGGEDVTFGEGGPRCVVALDRAGADPPELAGPPARASRHAAWGMAVALVLVTGASFWLLRDRNAAWAGERARLQARLDSALTASELALGSMESQVEGLREALAESRARIRTLATELERATTSDDGELRALRGRLQEATAVLGRQRLAASLDFEAIVEGNWRALAQIYVEHGEGQVVTGTAFAVRADGILVTAGHVMRPPEGGEAGPARIAVQFAGSAQVWPGTLLDIAEDADLALLRVERVVGDVPVVAGLNTRPDTLISGIPVAMMGFPLGGAGEGGGSPERAVPRPLTTAGVVERVDRHVLLVQGYGERGGSGSPVFDADGRVVGVLYGGRVDGERQQLFGEPVDALRRILDRLSAAPAPPSG